MEAFVSCLVLTNVAHMSLITADVFCRMPDGEQGLQGHSKEALFECYLKPRQANNTHTQLTKGVGLVSALVGTLGITFELLACWYYAKLACSHYVGTLALSFWLKRPAAANTLVERLQTLRIYLIQ